MKKEENEKTVIDILKELKPMFFLFGFVAAMCFAMYYLDKQSETLAYNYENKNMSEAFFNKYKATMDKYGIISIKNEERRGFYAAYELNTEEKMNMKKITIPRNSSYHTKIDCPVNIIIYINNETNTLKYAEKDIMELGKDKVFELTEKCLQGTTEGIDFYIEKEKKFFEEFKVKG